MKSKTTQVRRKFTGLGMAALIFLNGSSVGLAQESDETDAADTTTTTLPATSSCQASKTKKCNLGDFSSNGNSCNARIKDAAASASKSGGTTIVTGSTTADGTDPCLKSRCDDETTAKSKCDSACPENLPSALDCRKNTSVTVDGGDPKTCQDLNYSASAGCALPADAEQCKDLSKDYTKAAASCQGSCITNGSNCAVVEAHGDKAKPKEIAKCPSASKAEADDNEKQMKNYEERMKEDREKLAKAQEDQSKDTESSQNALNGLNSQIKGATTQEQQINIQLQAKMQSLKESTDASTNAAQQVATQLNNKITDLQTTQAAEKKNTATQQAQAVLDKCWTDAGTSTKAYFAEIARGNTQFSGNPTAFNVSQQLSLAASGNKTSQQAGIRNIYYAQCLNTQVAKSAIATVQGNLQTSIVALNSNITQTRQNIIDLQTNLSKTIQNATNQGNIAQAQAASAAYKLSQDVQDANNQLQQKNQQIAQSAARAKLNVDQLTAQEQEDETNYNNFKGLYEASRKSKSNSRTDSDTAKDDAKKYTTLNDAAHVLQTTCCDGASKKFSSVPDGVCTTSSAVVKSGTAK